MGTANILPLILIVILVILNLWQGFKLVFLSRSPIGRGVLSGAAGRFELRVIDVLCRLRIVRPVSLVCFDLRKLHELNALLGYERMTKLMGQIVAGRKRRGGRDIKIQWGGDEFVTVVWSHHAAHGYVNRLLEMMANLTAELSPAERAAIEARTGGLVDGFHASIVTVPCTRYPVRDARRGIDRANVLKSGGTQTGERATSGVAGTLQEVMV